MTVPPESTRDEHSSEAPPGLVDAVRLLLRWGAEARERQDEAPDETETAS